MAGGAGVPVGDLIVPYGIFWNRRALIPEGAEGALADMPSPKSCECKGEALPSRPRVDELRGPGAAPEAGAGRLGSIRTPANTHPLQPQADTELWATQTER